MRGGRLLHLPDGVVLSTDDRGRTWRTAVARAAGTGVAEILWRSGRYHQAQLADFSAEAYLAFDETIARRRRRLGSPT